jgi:hypothetical protein
MDTCVIATYRYRHEAEFARAFLEMEGISAMVSTDDAGGVYPAIMAPVRLLVRHEDAIRAGEVLARNNEEESGV